MRPTIHKIIIRGSAITDKLYRPQSDSCQKSTIGVGPSLKQHEANKRKIKSRSFYAEINKMFLPTDLTPESNISDIDQDL